MKSSQSAVDELERKIPFRSDLQHRHFFSKEQTKDKKDNEERQ
jgi:hypothetical protein